MSALSAFGATFHDRLVGSLGPLTFSLQAGERYTLEAASSRAASIAARLCAAIVKPMQGAIYIGDYDTRLQPPQAKRRLGFVDVAGVTADARTFACEVALRADVWGLDRDAAQRRAQELLRAFSRCPERHARAAALALVTDVQLIILDQPAAALREAMLSAFPELTVVDTRVTSTVTVPAREAVQV